MCKRIGTASFLAAAFHHVDSSRISYEELAGYRKKIAETPLKDGRTFAVSWSQDSLSSVLGGRMDVFRAQDDGVWCNRERLPSISAFSIADSDVLKEFEGSVFN